MTGERAWYAGKVARRSGTRAPIDVLARQDAGGWEAVPAPRKLFPKTGQVELQGQPALEASAGEWLAFQAAEEGHPGSRLTRVGAHRFLSRFADLRRLGTVEDARFLFTREGWDGAVEPGHWTIRFCDDRVLAVQLERARDGRLRCPERNLGKVACMTFDEDRIMPEPIGAADRSLYDYQDEAPLATHDWSAGADYVAHVVRALAGADDPRLPELIAWLELHKEEKTGRISAIGTEHELAFEALRSGELAARLTADREVMAAYLAAARSDPAISAAIDEAIDREARLAGDVARQAAERDLEAEFTRRKEEQEGQIAKRETALWESAEVRLVDRERDMASQLDVKRMERAAKQDADAQQRLAEATALLEGARAGAAEADEQRQALTVQVAELRIQAERLQVEADAAIVRAEEAGREAAESTRRGIAALRPVAAVPRPNGVDVPIAHPAGLADRIARCPLLTQVGKGLMADFIAFMLAGEVPVLTGSQADDFALVAEGLVAAGRLIPFDADETVIAPDDIWSRPGSGLASQVSQAAALADEGQTHLVQLRGIERSAAHSWHPALASLARRGLLPRRLLLFATLCASDAPGRAELPERTCIMAIEDAIAAGAALLATRLLGSASGGMPARLDPGERPSDLSTAAVTLATLAADGVVLGMVDAVRAARVATEAVALTADDATAAERAVRNFLAATGRVKSSSGGGMEDA